MTNLCICRWTWTICILLPRT